MNGAGNIILVLDLRGTAILPTPAEARAIHHASGLDYDQMMVLSDPRDPATAAYVRIYNNDGSEAEACGNGTRCVADRLARESGATLLAIETVMGRVACERLGEWRYRVDMGPPRFAWDEIPLARAVDDTRRVELVSPGLADYGPASVVNMGNPHAIFWVKDVAAIPLEIVGPRFETHPLFPDKANVSFAQVTARDTVKLRVWERGVGITLACGSAACATLVAAARLGLTDREARIALPGGELTVEWRESDGRVLMAGPVEFEREIALAADAFEGPGRTEDSVALRRSPRVRATGARGNGRKGASVPPNSGRSADALGSCSPSPRIVPFDRIRDNARPIRGRNVRRFGAPVLRDRRRRPRSALRAALPAEARRANAPSAPRKRDSGGRVRPDRRSRARFGL